MKDINPFAENLELLNPHQKMTIQIGNKEEFPTRDEFYTNYPFFKYWKKENNEKISFDPGINIYIHIPFCMQICDYCFYMKELIKSKDEVNDYIDTLCNEMKLISEKFNLPKRKVNSIYIGGGTPSVLTESQFKKLTEAIYKYHSLDNTEFTWEAEPGTFNNKKLEWYKDSGVNRISMGVQSFDDEIIKLSSRKHSAQQAINSIQMVKDMGSFVLNIDLLSGLAGEKMDTWVKSVDVALKEQVETLTIYKMKAYSNTVFFEKGVHKKEIKLPTEAEEVEFMKVALDMIQDANYNFWTTFAFSKNNYRHKYAENTWRGQDCIAYGASSFGKIGNISYQNLNSIQNYSEKIKNDQLPIYRSYSLTSKDIMIKELLLCSSRLFSYSKKEFIDKYGFDYFNLIPETIAELTEKGFITDNKSELTLTKEGIIYADFIGKVIASSVKNKIGEDSIGFNY